MYIECGNMSVWTIFAMLITQETHSMISKYTHRAINGYYCASGYIMNHTETDHQQCVAHCITSPSCPVLSYNLRGKYCLLGAEPCVVTAASRDFCVMTFRTLDDVSDVSKIPCINWRWFDGTEYPPVQLRKYLITVRWQENKGEVISTLPHVALYLVGSRFLLKELCWPYIRIVISWWCQSRAVWHGCHMWLVIHSPKGQWREVTWSLLAPHIVWGLWTT